MVGISHETGELKELELVGAESVRELRCVTLIAEDDSTYTIRVADGMTPEQFRERVIALGINRFKSADISAASEEIPWMESLFDGFTFQGKTEWTRPPGPIIYGPFVVKVTLTNRYFRALAKIGFHYFLTKYPRFRGDEPCFEEIRNFITHDCRVDEIGRFVTQSQKQFVYQLREGYGNRCFRIITHVFEVTSTQYRSANRK
jgi:hypothetical protein